MEMGKIQYLTEEEYYKTKTTFIENQKEKERFYYHGELNSEGEWEEWTTPRKMTNTWEGLQKEYDNWNKNRFRNNTTYFII